MLRKSVGVLRSIELQNNVGGDCAATDTLTEVSRMLSPVTQWHDYYRGRILHIMVLFSFILPKFQFTTYIFCYNKCVRQQISKLPCIHSILSFLVPVALVLPYLQHVRAIEVC